MTSNTPDSNEGKTTYEVHEKEVKLPGGRFFGQLTQTVIWLIPAAFIFAVVYSILGVVHGSFPGSLLPAAAGIIWAYGAYVTALLFWSKTHIKEVVIDDNDEEDPHCDDSRPRDDNPPDAS